MVLVYALANLNATPLWHDEGYTLGAINDLETSLRQTHGTMGLYYSFMWLWGQVSTATWWLRLPSVLFALAALVVFRRVARRIGGSDLVMVALPLAAMLPVFAWKSVEARSYSLEILLVCLCWLVAMTAVEARDDRTAIIWSLALVPLAAAGVLTHGLFLVHLAPIALIAALGPHGSRSIRWMAPSAVTGLSMTWYLHTSGADSVGVKLLGGSAARIQSILSMYLSTSPVVRLLLLVLLVLGTTTTLSRARQAPNTQDRAWNLVPLAWTFVPMGALLLAASLLDAPFVARYLAPCTMGIALLVATAAGEVDRRIRSATRSVAFVSGFGPISVIGLLIAAAGLLVIDPLHNDDWRGAAILVSEESLPTDGVIFATHPAAGPMHNRVPFEAAWREVGTDPAPAVVSPPRPLGEVRRFETWIAEENLPLHVTHHQRLWIIEHQESGEDRSTAIRLVMGDLGFETVSEWELSGDLSIILLARDG